MEQTVMMVRGPRYTVSGDFHYCVIEAESSSAVPNTFRVAVALSDSPGAQMGEEWRARHIANLWLIPTENPIAPFDVAIRALNNWYLAGTEEDGACLTCGGTTCGGACYPESEPVQASEAATIPAGVFGVDGHTFCCWSPRVTCATCGEWSACSGCQTCYNQACADGDG